MKPIRLIIAGNFRHGAGYSESVLQYIQHGPDNGIEVAVSPSLSQIDSVMLSKLRLVDERSWPTHMLLMFDANRFLSHSKLDKVEHWVPRHRRLVFDGDGQVGPVVRVGADTSDGAYRQSLWQRLIFSLADVVLQPRWGSLPSGVIQFPFFGLPEAASSRARSTTDDWFRYIGNNWWRWAQMAGILTRIADHRPLGNGRICISGKWWDGEELPGYREATRSDPAVIRLLEVDIERPVPVGMVVDAMSGATYTALIGRPIVAAQRLLTPRMLESVASSAIPIVSDEFRYVREIWQSDAGITTSELEFVDLADKEVQRVQRVKMTDIRRRLEETMTYRHQVESLYQILSEM